jgi:hypothetical protein
MHLTYPDAQLKNCNCGKRTLFASSGRNIEGIP